LYGVALVVIMLYRPKGLWPAPQHGIAAIPADGPEADTTARRAS